MWALIFTWKFVCDRFLPGSVLILPRSGFQISVASLFPGEDSHALNFVKFLGDVDMKTSLRVTAVCCYPLHSLPSVCLLKEWSNIHDLAVNFSSISFYQQLKN